MGLMQEQIHIHSFLSVSFLAFIIFSLAIYNKSLQLWLQTLVWANNIQTFSQSIYLYPSLWIIAKFTTKMKNPFHKESGVARNLPTLDVSMPPIENEWMVQTSVPVAHWGQKATGFSLPSAVFAQLFLREGLEVKECTLIVSAVYLSCPQLASGDIVWRLLGSVIQSQLWCPVCLFVQP